MADSPLFSVALAQLTVHPLGVSRFAADLVSQICFLFCMQFTEQDWKVLRALHAEALERFCARMLRECQSLIEQRVHLTTCGGRAHFNVLPRWWNSVSSMRTRSQNLA